VFFFTAAGLSENRQMDELGRSSLDTRFTADGPISETFFWSRNHVPFFFFSLHASSSLLKLVSVT
jgi:hypothetical protein